MWGKMKYAYPHDSRNSFLMGEGGVEGDILGEIIYPSPQSSPTRGEEAATGVKCICRFFIIISLTFLWKFVIQCYQYPSPNTYNQMRVIGGKVKRHKIKGVGKRTTRAVTDRIKESVFAILGDISGKRVLDLFAGTGSFGIESLSRGAVEAIFVDNDRECVRTIRKNLSTLGLKANVYAGDVRSRLKRGGLKMIGSKKYQERGCPRVLGGRKRFDLIFVDPPFAGSVGSKGTGCPPKDFDGISYGSSSLAEETLRELSQLNLVNDGGVVIVRHHNKQSLPEKVGAIRLNRKEKYGENIVCFYG